MYHPHPVFPSEGSTLTLDQADKAAGAAQPQALQRNRQEAASEPAFSAEHSGQYALLVAEEDSPHRQPLVHALESRGYTTRITSSSDAAREAMRRLTPDVALLDAAIVEDEKLIKELKRSEVRVIVIDTENSGATLEQLDGSAQYLAHPADAEQLRRLLSDDEDDGHAEHRSATSNGKSRRSRTAPLPTRAPAEGCGVLVGESEQMRGIYDMIAKVAPTDATVFIAGESGTGKELVAEAIHQRSTRANRAFVALNCGAIPEGLIDSELFGHEKGAFTGATRARGGVFEQANGGTLFLDEITEMPIDLQARLLRVLETGRVHRVGGDRDIPVDVRVLAASNRPAVEAVDQGRLREDLLYRLSVFPIQMPPLRERSEDAIVLANHFLAELNEQAEEPRRFSHEALELIRSYHWPGNVRQLRHAVHRAFILAGEIIEARYLPAQVSHRPAESNGKVQLPVGTSIAEAERQLISATLEHYNGDKKKAADVLGMSLRTLYNRLNIYKAQESETAKS